MIVEDLAICHAQYWLKDINLLRISGLSNGVGHYDEGREDMIDEAIYKSSLMTPHVSLTAEDDKTSTLILPSLAPIVPGIPFILQIWISFTYNVFNLTNKRKLKCYDSKYIYFSNPWWSCKSNFKGFTTTIATPTQCKYSFTTAISRKPSNTKGIYKKPKHGNSMSAIISSLLFKSLIYSQNIYGLVSIKLGYSCSRHSEGSSTRPYNTPATYNFVTVFIIVVEGNSRKTSFRRQKIRNATWSWQIWRNNHSQ